MGENNICPICRRVIKNKVKLIFQFSNKSQSTCGENTLNTDCGESHTNPDTTDLRKENSKLTKEKKILQEEKSECERKLTQLNEQLAFYADQFGEMNVYYYYYI